LALFLEDSQLTTAKNTIIGGQLSGSIALL
jgi:hypothetical protein